MTGTMGLGSWQSSMKSAIRDARELCRQLHVDVESIGLSADGESQFPVFVTLEYLSRIRKGDPRDPLLLQVLPTSFESNSSLGFHKDPVGDGAVEVVPGLLHKYAGRVLMVLSGACAIHCRYCFRRHYPYSSAPKSLADWEPALDYIASDSSIHEVILSGGDPLTITDSVLSQLSDRFNGISHLKRLRIHTRLPVVIPHRVDRKLIEWVQGSRLSKWVVLHINHAREIDEDVADAVRRLKSAGATILNQSVLLRGVNDSVESLFELSERLMDIGVVPYYLHQLDRVEGASHFEVEPELGLRLIDELNTRLSGYGVPKYVQEIAGQPSKISVDALERLEIVVR